MMPDNLSNSIIETFQWAIDDFGFAPLRKYDGDLASFVVFEKDKTQMAVEFDGAVWDVYFYYDTPAGRDGTSITMLAGAARERLTAFERSDKGSDQSLKATLQDISDDVKCFGLGGLLALDSVIESARKFHGP